MRVVLECRHHSEHADKWRQAELEAKQAREQDNNPRAFFT